MPQTFKKILKFTGIILVLIQIISWVGVGAFFKEGEEHPMSGIGNFIVDDAGNIIVEEGFYSVIQVYDKNGKFVSSFTPQTRNPVLFLGENNAIIIDGGELKYYDLQGREIINKEIALSKNGESNRKHYRVEGGIFFPKIIKTLYGEETVIVQQSFLLNLFKAPVPFFGLGVLAFFSFCILGTKKTLEEAKDK